MKQSLNCGSCLHLVREKCFEKRCVELGKLPTSKGCASHKPDVFALVGDEPKHNRMELLSAAITGMSPTELQALAAVLHTERNTRKYGWKFYQKVYVRYTGSSDRNYLSNFTVGYVLYADKETVRIVGESGKMFISAINEKDGQTVYDVKRFTELRRSMMKARHFVDPKAAYGAVASDRGTIAPLDDVLDQVPKLSKKLSKARSKDDDLVSIISRMQRGMIGRGGRRAETAGRRGTDTAGSEISFSY